MCGDGGLARCGPRGRVRSLAAAAVTLLLLAWLAGATAAADVAVVRIEYKVNGGLGQNVAGQGDRVDVIAYVKNLGSSTVSGVSVSYVYVDEVLGFKFPVQGTYALADIDPGEVEQSTVHSWFPTGVSAGRYHFEATASINGSPDDVPCNSTFPRRDSSCLAVDGTDDPASIVILSSQEQKRLIQPLFEDPAPAKGIRLPTGCVVSFTSGGLSSTYVVPLANVGSDVLPVEVTAHEDRGYMAYVWDDRTSGFLIEDQNGRDQGKEDLLSNVQLFTNEAGTGSDFFVNGLGARYNMTFQLDFGYLSDSFAAAPNFADPVEVGILVRLFHEDAISTDYNQFTIPGTGTLDVYTPVIKWIYPGCETTGSDRPLGVAPGLRTGQFEPRVYVPVIAADGGYDLLVMQVTSTGLGALWRVENLPDRVVGLDVDEEAEDDELIYLSFIDGSVMAIQHVIFLGFGDEPEVLWTTSVGQGVSRPQVVGHGESRRIAVASVDGLHLAPVGSNGAFELVEIKEPGGGALTMVDAPLPVGGYAFFTAGEWIGRVDVSSGDMAVEDIQETLELLPTETITSSLAADEANSYVFFGTVSGRLYALGASEPMVSLSRTGRSIQLQQDGATRISSIEVIEIDEDEAWLFASTLDGGIYRVLFDLKNGEFETDKLEQLITEDNDLALADLPSGGLAGISVSRHATSRSDDVSRRAVLSIGLDGEILAYDGDLRERVECHLWGEEDKDRRRPFLFDIGAPLSSWTAWEASNTTYLVVTSEETGQLFGLDLGFIHVP
jgi:hypothetical protein